MTNMEITEEQRITTEAIRAVAKIQTGVLTLSFALICGVGLFLMTAWLVVRKGPMVGAHLNLLRHYFPGYAVTWTGSVVGFFYGMLTGGVVGWTIGTIYNKVVRLRHPQRA